MSKSEFKEMFDSAVHVGHRTQKWNPRMKKFLFGEQDGIHIINLEKTATYLEQAVAFLSKMASEGKVVLFVSTKPQTLKLIEDIAGGVSMPFVSSRWIPGLLTNFKTIKARVKYLADLKGQKETGEFKKYTKKEASSLDKTIVKLEASLGGVQNLSDLPDCVFVVDVVRDQIAVKEAKRLGLPVVAILDSNSNPSGVDFPIPGNDDALKSLKYLLSRVQEALKKKSAKTSK
ncbi:30S ribosomal protein S2 [Candidatus Peregrinibacteria bacterium CG10_big_fil_rev_8_21_14_0_10_36_19]|nr:MAG: 30S ribosomal protein S2 [Candidatus Peregrinibacteria bacterium CG10_big_fil_rev_8_21_14_0_10_36_19]